MNECWSGLNFTQRIYWGVGEVISGEKDDSRKKREREMFLYKLTDSWTDCVLLLISFISLGKKKKKKNEQSGSEF